MVAMTVAIHGGCGTLGRGEQSEADWEDTRRHLGASLRAAWAVLRAGGRSLDAVEAAVVLMEDSPHFNAGHGAALNENSEHELDASIMDGATLAAGAVCAVRRVRNPIRAARAVLERGDCVLLCGLAADEFAGRCGLPLVDNAYFTTERRVRALSVMKALARRGTIGCATEAERHGTVGAVALDAQGNLAAATSTGGYNNKPVGRVGDSALPGAGTYARNGVCAVSCTGQGEVFIRCVAAHQLAARMLYAGQSLADAARAVVFDDVGPHGAGAGMVAIDAQGAVQLPFNTLGMARGWIGGDGVVRVATHQEVHSLGAA